MLGGLFKQIHIAFEANANKNLQKHNLTSAQMDMIIYLNEHRDKDVTQRDLEEAFRLKNPTVTGILNRLEEKGLIERRKNENDKRYRIISLTEKSELLLQKVCIHFKELENEHIFKDFSEEEKMELERLLKKILKNLNDR